ncbi:hypothetical protein SAMN04488092_1071 [Thalassovita taeanensis]|uniref:Uncharacterized protein n=1 Tax=Thalassovita taeanensis TaxID=657014 RepID=A0A1H9G1J7_9RHOB|nr:hypothetical protein SAMN04488092_1071 [Thalassovita taeanensis]
MIQKEQGLRQARAALVRSALYPGSKAYYPARSSSDRTSWFNPCELNLVSVLDLDNSVRFSPAYLWASEETDAVTSLPHPKARHQTEVFPLLGNTKQC